MIRAVFAVVAAVLPTLALQDSQQPVSKEFLKPAESRTFSITYTGLVKEIPAGTRKLRVWLPVPQDSTVQQIRALKFSREMSVATEAKYGNKIAYAEIESPGTSVEITMTFECTRQEIRSDLEKLAGWIEAQRPWATLRALLALAQLRQRTPGTGRTASLWTVSELKILLMMFHEDVGIVDSRARIDAFTDDYNHHRPHRSLAGRTTPAVAYTTRPNATPTGTPPTHHRVRHDLGLVSSGGNEAPDVPELDHAEPPGRDRDRPEQTPEREDREGLERAQHLVQVSSQRIDR